MTDANIAVAGMPPGRSRPIEKALHELAHVAVTEACVSGLCDICLEQPTCRRDVFGPPWRDSHSPRRSGK